MADIRPKDLATTATAPAADDYLLLDGTTLGTRNIRASGIVSIKQFNPAGDGTTDDAAAFQALFDYAYANNKRAVLDGGTYRIINPVGFPDNLVNGIFQMELDGQGATIIVGQASDAIGGGEPIFTSKRSLASPESTDDLYTAKINITGITFKAHALFRSIVFNGDRLYNLFVSGCNFSQLGAIIKSSRTKTGGAAGGYMQSVTFNNNHLSTCWKIVDAKQAYNFSFISNMCEECINGIYIDGTADPSLNVLRIRDNLYEGGGVFLKLGPALVALVDGNYLEGNNLVDSDMSTLKCHIHIMRTTGGYASAMQISNNQFSAVEAQKTDVDFSDIKFDHANTDQAQPPIVTSNWSNSYALLNAAAQVYVAFGNGGPGSVGFNTQAVKWNKTQLGFYGTTPISRAELPATPTAQDIATALVNLGLVTQA